MSVGEEGQRIASAVFQALVLGATRLEAYHQQGRISCHRSPSQDGKASFFPFVLEQGPVRKRYSDEAKAAAKFLEAAGPRAAWLAVVRTGLGEALERAAGRPPAGEIAAAAAAVLRGCAVDGGGTLVMSLDEDLGQVVVTLRGEDALVGDAFDAARFFLAASRWSGDQPRISFREDGGPIAWVGDLAPFGWPAEDERIIAAAERARELEDELVPHVLPARPMPPGVAWRVVDKWGKCPLCGTAWRKHPRDPDEGHLAVSCSGERLLAVHR